MSCSVQNFSAFIKDDINTQRVWLVKKIVNLEKSPEKNHSFLKIKYIRNKALETEIDSIRILLTKSMEPTLLQIRDYIAKVKTPETQHKIKQNTKDKTQEPMEIKLSINSLSLCLYECIPGEPLSSKEDMIVPSGPNALTIEDNLVLLNFAISTQTVLVFHSNSLRAQGNYLELSLSLTPKKKRHLDIKFRQDYVIFPTKLTFNFNFSSELYPIQIKRIGLNAIFLEEVILVVT